MATATKKEELKAEAEEPKEEPKAEAEAPETEEKKSLTSEMMDEIKSVVSEMIGALKPEKTTVRKSYRDEEDEMESLVGEKVKELLEREKAEGSKNAETKDKQEIHADPEIVPGQQKKRRVEKGLWGQ